MDPAGSTVQTFPQGSWVIAEGSCRVGCLEAAIRSSTQDHEPSLNFPLVTIPSVAGQVLATWFFNMQTREHRTASKSTQMQRQNDNFSAREPLLRYALEHLPVASLGKLRQASKATRELVDQGTGSVWKAAASEIIEPGCLPGVEDGYAVQAKLQQYGIQIAQFLAGASLFLCKSLPAYGH